MLFLHHCVGLLDLPFFDLHQEEVARVNFLQSGFISFHRFQDDGISFGVVRFVPLIVVGVLGSRANAYFYIAFTVVTADAS